MRGNIIESRGPGVAYYVQLDNDSAWYVPEELLQKLPGEDVVEEAGPVINIGDHVKVIVNQNDLDLVGCDDTVKSGHKYIVQDVEGESIQLVRDAPSWVNMKDVVLVKEDMEKPDPCPTLNEIIRFTQNNKGFNVSIEDGNMTIIDWSNDPNATFYRPKTIEELLELMELIGKINVYKCDNE